MSESSVLPQLKMFLSSSQFMRVACWKKPLAILGNLLGADVQDMLLVLVVRLGTGLKAEEGTVVLEM